MKDIYLRFTNVKGGTSLVDAGESKDGEHAKWIEVDSWSHLIRQPRSATSSSSGGHTAERCEHGEMVFTKDIDSISPLLWQACSDGTMHEQVEIHFMRAHGNKRVTYLEIKLKHVLVGSVTPSVQSEGLPKETLSLKYASVEWNYQRQKFDGSADAKKTGKWSLSTNKAEFNAPA